ncbi:hypothetical protein BKA70DRAFT_1479675 [Coprinopsis sp. MPI-PUGE-AT-0042]|nr:hypothetical protein BKA70DRAFT_1479675 [Coprinopsis sp. MPI-PUGE-AT-0042]
MSSRMSIDSQLIPFTLSNDPLPDELKPLLDEQLGMCDGYLDDAQRTILEVEDNIRALEETLHRLKEKRNDYHQRIEEFRATKASLHSCASVVRRVPAEIIAEIMQLAVNNGASESFGGERAVFLVLRCVSKLWRRTAFSTPSLWKHVSLALSEFSGDHEDAKSRLFSALNNWFSCAGEKADLNLVVSGINTTTLGADDMFEWLQISHFNISHLVLFELVPSVDALHQ